MDVGALVNKQYKIIEHIGRGGMADVWSARDTRLRRMVAIKTIVSGLSSDIDPVALFEKEAHTIAQMEHPHILPIYDFGEYDNNLYIVMRYVTGGSLEDLLREGPMPPQDVLRMADAIGQALDHAHSNNVIHLDLKPPNILLDSSGAPYLADFGLATVLDTQGRARNPGSGTLLYMAPEQMLSDTIDHRADVYSFCVMLFHMLTGTLPFEGTIPIAMSQVQRDLGLPDLDDYNTQLPHELSELLRLGTSQEPKFRPSTHMEIVDEFRNILQPAGIAFDTISFDDDIVIEANPYDMLTEIDEDNIRDVDLLEAIDIYSRARYDWQGGQGRFLLGVTNFILISDYYQNAADYDLKIDSNGYQVLLRGALEYDHEIDYWWSRLDDDNRRWVCLHALRSGNTPARIRALYRLETLPDETGTAVIPRLVAQALEVETDINAKLAALKVLATRVQLMKKNQKVRLKTEYQGRLITSMTRLGIDISPPEEWRDVAYSNDVDVLIAEQVFDHSPVVAEAAARTVGRIRSLKAVEHLSREQQNKRSGALEALALVRDETPTLPDIVRRDARFYAWITNTVRRLTQRPIELIANIVLVFIVGWLAMGNHIWGSWQFTFGSLGAQRWTNTVALGVIFGLMMSLTYILTVVISERLEGFWTWWMRLLVSGILGFGIAILSWTSYRYFFLQEALFEILWDQMRFAGAALAFGLLATSLLRLRAWQGVILTTVMTFMTIYFTYRGFYFFEQSNIAPVAIITMLIGVFCGWKAAELSNYKAQLPIIKLPMVAALVGAGLGALWVAGIWNYYLIILLPQVGLASFTWDTVLLLATANLLLGMILSYYATPIGRISFAVVALGGFIAAYIIVSPQFNDYYLQVPLAQPAFEVLYAAGTPLMPATAQPIIWYREQNLEQLYTLTLPFLLVIALGMNLPNLLSGWWQWIGQSRTPKERGAWLTATMGYTMVVTALVSMLTLYSPQINRLWELSWSFWAFVTFVCAMATFRWAKWGADGLLISGVVLLIGGIIFDGVAMFEMASNGMFPRILGRLPQLQNPFEAIGLTIAIHEYHLWGLWAVLLGLFVWGAQRRLLWGGIGLVGLVIAWYLVVFSLSLQGSVAILAATHVALIYFALSGKYHLMEVSRLPFAWAARGSQIGVVSGMDTVVDVRDSQFQSVPATQILPQHLREEKPDTDGMQTQVPSMNAMRNLETVDFNQVPKASATEMSTAAPIEINPEDLKTAFPKDAEFMDFDSDLDMTDPAEDGVIEMDTYIDIGSMTPDEAEDDEVITEPQTGLTDIKINLDTSALKQPDTDPSDAETEPKTSLTDIKINLDTSALKQPDDDQQAPTQPKPIFKFDSSAIINKNTMQFDSTTDDNDDDKTSSDTQTEPKTGLTDIKINLDTSSLKKRDEAKEVDSSSAKTEPKTGLTDIKINLDTSSLKKRNEDATPDDDTDS